jgi:hypothetical protein
LDEEQLRPGHRGELLLRQAGRKIAGRHHPPASFAEVEQQPCPRRLSACKDPDLAPSPSARGLTGSAPAVRQAAADYLDAAPRPFAHIQACGAWAHDDCFGSRGRDGLAMPLPRLR